METRRAETSILRKLTRAFWVVLAVLFLIEAWLWDHLEPVVARIVALIPLEGLKAALVRLIHRLSPPATLVVFAVPFVLLLPLKFLEVLLIVKQQWLGTIVVLVAAKLVGLGITAFIDEGQAPTDGLVPEGLRLLHLAARLGAREGRSNHAPAAQMATPVTATAGRPVLRASHASPPPHAGGVGVVSILDSIVDLILRSRA
jgi:hypothetical protein